MDCYAGGDAHQSAKGRLSKDRGKEKSQNIYAGKKKHSRHQKHGKTLSSFIPS
jgi:hypothetical protein